MSKPTLSLQVSEAVVLQAAANIYAAYINTSRVTPGQEKVWIERSIQEAILIAKLTDERIHSDHEMG
jgi:hypothetical protein